MRNPEKLQTFGFVRSIDEEARRVQVVVSTGDIARDGAIIDQRGWVFTNYDRNPVVLWGHDDSQLPIARAIPAKRVLTENELIETHEFAQHAAAEDIWQAVRGGFVNATSVRWLPGNTTIRQVNGQSVLVFTEGHELLESSYVTIPADPGALVMRADGTPLVRRDGARMVIDYTMDCGVRGCPNSGWDGTIDVCEFHLRLMQSGDMEMPPADEQTHSHQSTPATERRSEQDSQAGGLAAFAAHIRRTNELLKGA